MDETAVIQDGRYQITANDNGLYLSVWPPLNGGAAVSKAVITRELLERNCHDFDSAFISVIIRQALGVPVHIMNSLPQVDGRYEILANDSGIYLSVWPPAGGGLPVPKAAVFHALRERSCGNFDPDFIPVVIREAIGKPVQIAGPVAPADGRYEITANDGGVYLSVWPPTGGGTTVAKSAVIQELTARSFSGFDRNFITVIIQNALGVPVKIINSQPEGLQAAEIRVKVDAECMKAKISVSIPENAPPVSVEQLKAALQTAGVIYGIDEQVLAGLVQAKRPAEEILCASGTPPCSGEDAFLLYALAPNSQASLPETEEGKIDFKKIGSFPWVEEGQLLAEKMAATPGIAGTDVYGRTLPPVPGKDIALPAGQNVIQVDDWRLYAAISGQLRLISDQVITVVPVLVVDGDVDQSAGNIDFTGSLVIRGSIQAGVSVKAGGNIEVEGTISGGMAEGQSVIVRKGIRERSTVKAREWLAAESIEDATVYAVQDIVVYDRISGSAVSAGLRVFAAGDCGLLHGGRITAGELIRANTAGDSAGTVTELVISAGVLLKDELTQLHRERKKAGLLQEKLALLLARLDSQRAEELSPENRKAFERYTAIYHNLPQRREEIQQYIDRTEQLLYELKPGRVHIDGCAYAGTDISIGPFSRKLDQTLQASVFYLENKSIKVRTDSDKVLEQFDG